MIGFRQKGSFKNTEKLLKKSLGKDWRSILDQYGRMGIQALSDATPVETGETAISWGYEIIQNEGRISIQWHNYNVNKGINIAIILQYGHATRNGGWVEGRDYINPALRPIFDDLAKKAWKEVIGS